MENRLTVARLRQTLWRGVCGLGLSALVFACAPITPLPTLPQPPLPTPSMPSGSPPSGMPPSSLPSPSGQPSSSPSTPGSPSSSPPSSPPGSPGSSGAQGDPSSYDQLPSGGGLDGGGGMLSDGSESGTDSGETGPEGADSTDGSGDGGNLDHPTWEDLAGTGAEGSDSGWETSNELPDPDADGGGADADLDTADSGSGGQGDDPAGNANEDEFDGVLEQIDGEILAEVEHARSSAGSAPNIPTPTAAGEDPEATRSVQTASLPRSGPRTAPPTPPPPRRSGEQVPDDIPDAKDDDIIARQLREAAMAETDPELKEKLWEEYRKYKKG